MSSETPHALIELFVRFSRDVGASVTPTDVYDQLVQSATSELSAEAAIAFRVGLEGGLNAVASAGLPEGAVLPSIEMGMLGPELIESARALRPDLEHGQSLPLISHGGLYGAVVLLRSAPPDPRESALSEALIEVAAIAVENTARLEELRDSYSQLRDSRERLSRAESLRALGQMASVVAHEVKNPLAGIRAALQVLQRRQGEDSSEHQLMSNLIARLDSLNEMVQDLLVFARPRPLQLRPLDVRMLLESTHTFLTRTAEFAAVEVVITGESVTLPGDQQQLADIFLNLLSNAAQAMTGRGRIVIGIARTGGHCVIEVADSGPGVPVELRERIFEPFFTTRSRGSGLGLAIVRQTVEAHRGTVELVDGEGGRFVVRLPLALTS